MEQLATRDFEAKTCPTQRACDSLSKAESDSVFFSPMRTLT